MQSAGTPLVKPHLGTILHEEGKDGVTELDMTSPNLGQKRLHDDYNPGSVKIQSLKSELLAEQQNGAKKGGEEETKL